MNKIIYLKMKAKSPIKTIKRYVKYNLPNMSELCQLS